MVRRRRHIQPRFGPERAFGDVLRQLRNSRNLSQEKLGDVCDSDRTFVSMLERGLVSPTLRTIVKFSTALGVSPSQMIRRTEQSSFYRV
jgi:transcriptional regulator with XRE-family HTH domain